MVAGFYRVREMASVEESVGSNPSISPALSTPSHFSNHGTAPPDLKNSYNWTQNFGGACFNCRKQGHFARDCPDRLNNNRKLEPLTVGPLRTADSQIPCIQCPCGAGTCVIRTSRTERNPNRQFYACPAKFDQNCKYFQWCDMVKKDEIYVPSQSKYPTCGCGAGICSISTEKTGQYAGRRFFVCPVKKGQGACNFMKWEDESIVNSNVTDVESFSSPQCTLDTSYDSSIAQSSSSNVSNSGSTIFTCPDKTGNESQAIVLQIESSECHSKLKTSSVEPNNQLEHGADENGIFLANSSARETDEFQAKVLLAESSEDDSRMKISSVELNNQLGDGADENGIFLPNSSARELEKPRTKFCAEATSLGHDVLGWLGRLAFPPCRSLAELPPRPFYCCVFPSFDPIFVPWDVDVVDVVGSIIPPQSPITLNSEDQSLVMATRDIQFPGGLVLEPSGITSPLSTVQGKFMTASIIDAFGQAAIRVQNELIALLECMDPLDHEGMTREATSAFAALDCLHIDSRPFKERVENFISCAWSLAKIEQSNCEYAFSSKELVDWCSCEKAQFDDLARFHAQATAAVADFKESLQLLSGEASRLKNRLLQFENQLSCCEAKMVDMETHLVRMSQDMSEPSRILEALSQEAARKCQLLDAERSAARAALEKARVQLRQ